MSLIAGVNYDPTTAVSKATSVALAMTALDTTNLRLAFNAPASGKVLVRLRGVVHGSATTPAILLGIMDGATVVARVAPSLDAGTLSATSLHAVEAQITVTGLTPGAALTWDAAYGVETAVTSTGLKYGGPNNTTANDAFGAFIFEVWDV